MVAFVVILVVMIVVSLGILMMLIVMNWFGVVLMIIADNYLKWAELIRTMSTTPQNLVKGNYHCSAITYMWMMDSLWRRFYEGRRMMW